MAFLKSSQITGLSAKDVDVRGFTQADSINLGDRVYTEHEVLLADAYKIVGNVTVSDDLILSKLSDDGDDITITGDTTTREISGSGSIQGATLAQTPNADMTGMTGVLGSAVTGSPTLDLSNATKFPVGHVIQVQYAESNSYTTSASSTWQVKHAALVTITPRFSSSKILLIASFGTYMANAGVASYDFYKNASDFPENYNLSGMQYGLSSTEFDTNKWTNHTTIQYMDNAESTTEKTYGITGNSSGNVQTMYIGWGNSQLTTITAMEIAG